MAMCVYLKEAIVDKASLGLTALYAALVYVSPRCLGMAERIIPSHVFNPSLCLKLMRISDVCIT